MPTLVLVRHGATEAAEANRFAGWDDTRLSATGLGEAQAAAETLSQAGFVFERCFTSRLARAEETLAAAAAALRLPEAIVVRDWRLNERHYGALQGEGRGAAIQHYGNAQVVEWRRSYDAVPPPLGPDDPRWHEQLARLADVPIALQPRTESLAQAVQRVTPVWHQAIAPALRRGERVLVVAHTSSIRGLARAIEGLDDAASAAFRIATAVPRVYSLDDALRPLERTDLAAGVAGGLRYWANRLKPRWLGRY
jgi:2,3-bisphosphoglycerate-dependent phosphoglycerate mutase